MEPESPNLFNYVTSELSQDTVIGFPCNTYGEIMTNKYIIHCDKGFPKSGMFWNDEKALVIAEYNSIADLVDDGWRLD